MEVSAVSSFSSTPQAAPADADAITRRALAHLSAQFERLLNPAFLNRADADIVLAAGGGAVVGAYTCILAARSPFLHRHISSLPAGEKPRLELADLVPGGCHVGREALEAVLGYMYTGIFKMPPQKCVAETCCHDACRPAIDFIVGSTYAACGFKIPELVKLCQRLLSDTVDKAYAEDIVPIILVASTCQLFDLLNQCIEKVANSALNNYLEKQLPADVYNNIKGSYWFSLFDKIDCFIPDPHHEKMVKSIHMAIDSDNVDLVGMILKESSITLDDAFALHYAAACCTPNMLADLLKLNSANVNLMNNGGYTPLHMACMRLELEPGIILSLVKKGASVLQRTPDGRDALAICKRLAREKDFNQELENCQKRSNACLCIDILEKELEKAKGKCFTSDQASVEDTIFTPLLVDNLHKGLSYLENRAEADATEEFSCTSNEEEVGLNKTPTTQNRMLLKRLYVLTKTVELGREYFPNCSKVLDKFFDEDGADLALLENDNPAEDQLIKRRRRFFEIKEEVLEAFNKDMAAGAPIPSIASSSSSPRLDMLIPDTSSSQAAGVTDSANAPALSLHNQAPGTASGQPEAQGSDVAADNKLGVGCKTKLKSAVWKEIEKIKVGDDLKGKCRWCQILLSATSKNGTTHLRRHLNTCETRKAAKGGSPV